MQRTVWRKPSAAPFLSGTFSPDAAAFIADLEKWWNLFAGFSVAKRIQAPPLLVVSRRPYGYDLRESQLTPYYTDAYLTLREQLLAAASR